MSPREIRQAYRAIRLSKISSEEDKHKKQTAESDPFNFEDDDTRDAAEEDIQSLTEELCDPSTISVPNKEILQASEKNNNRDNKLNGLEKPKLLDATKIKFGYLDMPPMSNCEIWPIHIRPNFVAIQHTDAFCNADVETKAKMLSRHWSTLNKVKQTLTPHKKTDRSNFRTMVITDLDEGADDNTKGTYISRSGRLTKRKCYADCDEDSNESTIPTERSKINDRPFHTLNNNNNNDTESKVKSAIKKSKPTPTKDVEDNKNSGTTIRNFDYTRVLTPLEDNKLEDEFVDLEDRNPLEKAVQNEAAKTNATLRPKKLTNDEIMKRSSLFGGRTFRKKRSDEIFDKLMEDQEIKKREEKMIEKFEKSIDSPIIEDDESVENVPVEEVKVVYPRRVIPSIPRRGIGSRASKTVAAVSTSGQPMDNTTSQDPEVGSSPRTVTRRTPAIRDEDKIEVVPSTSTSDSSDFTDCPICLKSFHVDSIETHASTCGDDDVASAPSRQQNKRVQCEMCGARFPIGDRYTIHVTECLRYREEQDQLLHRYKVMKKM
ncbi:unnamed protein product [Acanthoscelides obtectus]|nr:unnamed protein product [Acanthoscelides obtectus]CAK1674167.1 hypothetical protein AOBTE_LOCUS29548 [Acanthoscelides obtectus]